MIAALLFFIVVAVTWCLVRLVYPKPHGGTSDELPPGPPTWPIIGNLDILASPKRHEKLFQAGIQYNGIFTIKLGAVKQVWITSYKHLREALLCHSWEFNDRPKHFWMNDETTDRHPGILSSGVDESGIKTRNFTRKFLRSLTLGRKSMENVILQQVEDLIEEFRKTGGMPFNPRDIIAHAAANIISSVVLGKTFQQGDEGLRSVNETLTSGVKQLINAQRDKIFPFIRYVPLRSRKILRHSFQTGKKFLAAIVGEHFVSRTGGLPRDYIDAWLDESEKGQESAEIFTKERLPNILVDLFSGGYETVTTTIQWSFSLLLRHPEVQQKIHEEMDRNLSKESQVTLDDQRNLPYCHAVILETLRMYPPAPFAVPHMASVDSTIGHHKIPKGTRIMFHLYSIHHDPDSWDSPETFRPKRFLQDGKIKMPDAFVAFGAGLRPCIAEELGRKELFLLFSNILQRFRIVFPDPNSLPSTELMQGAVLYPRPFEIKVEERY